MIAVAKKNKRLLLRAIAATATLALASCGLWMDSEDMLARARQEQEKGDLRAALVDLRTLLRKDPQMLEARVALGEVSLQMGDVASAIRELELARNSSLPLERVAAPLARAYLAGQRATDALALLDSMPTLNSDAGLSALRGTSLLALNRGAEAKQAFETAVRVDPKSVDSLLGLASAVAIDDVAAGLALTDRALALAPDEPRVRLARGALQMQGNHFAEAEKEYRAAAELAKKHKNSTYVLAALAGVTESLLARDDAAGALTVTAQLQELAPKSPVIRYLRARALFQAGKPGEARPLLEQNLSDNAQVANSQLLLGAVKLALGDLGQAEMYLASVVAADPSNSAARRLLAEARLRQSKPKDALDAIAPMLDKPDASKELLALAGRASLAAGATASGLEYLQRGAKLQPADVGAQLDLVAGYVATGKFDEARAVLDSLPNDGEVSARRTFLQVLAQLGARDPKAALETARTAAAAAPKDATTQALAGAVFAQAGQLAAAKPYLQRALQAEPGHSGASIALAQVLAATNDLAGAIEVLAAARKAHPNLIEAGILQTELLMATGDAKGATALATELVDKAPDNPAAYIVQGRALTAAGNQAESVRVLTAATRRLPRSAGLRYELARTLAANGQNKEAADAARTVLDVEPGHLAALDLLGRLAILRGDWTEAQQRSEQLLQKAPNQAQAQIFAGDLLLARKDYAGAAAAYRKAGTLAADPTIALREFEALRQGQLPQPLRPLETLIAKNPNDIRTRIMLADAQQKLGLMDAAARNYEQVLKQQPDNAVALNNLAWYRHGKGDASALDLARRAHERAPKSLEITDTYAWILVQRGQTGEGLKLLAAIDGASTPPEVRLHYAVALARSGKREEAQRIVDSVSKLPANMITASMRDLIASASRE